MDIEETSLLEEQVSCESEVVSDTGHGTDSVGARTQVSNFSQILVGVLLLCQGVFTSITVTNNFGEVSTVWSGNLELESLTLSGTLDQSTLDLKTSSYISLGDLIITFDFFGNDDLNILIRKWKSLPKDPSN